jgi:hypothetical protein
VPDRCGWSAAAEHLVLTSYRISSCYSQGVSLADLLGRDASEGAVKRPRGVTRRSCRISRRCYWLSPNPRLQRWLRCTSSKREERNAYQNGLLHLFPPLGSLLRESV